LSHSSTNCSTPYTSNFPPNGQHSIPIGSGGRASGLLEIAVSAMLRPADPPMPLPLSGRSTADTALMISQHLLWLKRDGFGDADCLGKPLQRLTDYRAHFHGRTFSPNAKLTLLPGRFGSVARFHSDQSISFSLSYAGPVDAIPSNLRK
jgi:hypothetical protein